MYKASKAFHQAVQDGNPQKALLIFDDAVFTNEDIDIDNGISFSDYFNLDDDIAIGQTPSNEISFTLFNDDGRLDSYSFGEFTATLGVLVSESNYTQRGSVYAVSSNATYIGSDQEPYLKRNNRAVSHQPSFPVKSILVYDGYVYCFDNAKHYIVYKDSNGQYVDTAKVNMFMRSKSVSWEGMGIYYNPSTRILSEWVGGVLYKYEFVPLGVFSAVRPNVMGQIEIDFTCNDQMQKFEVDMPSASALGIKYPTTIGNLFSKICSYLKVKTNVKTFINSTATISAEPDSFSSATMRTVLGWIAEAAAANAKFDRDGYLRFEWIRAADIDLNENDYTEFEPYWYKTQRVNRVRNRTLSGGKDTTYGSGSINYLIQDNPLLKEAT